MLGLAWQQQQWSDHRRSRFSGYVPPDEPDRAKLLTDKILATLATGRLRFLPYTDPHTQETAEMRRAYRRMLKEPAIKAPLLDKVFAVASLDLQVNPAVEDDERQKEKADFAKDLIVGCPGGLRLIAERVLLPALIEGYSVCEPDWQLATRGKWRWKYTLADLYSPDSDWYTLEVDDRNRIRAVTSRFTNEVWAPSEFVIFRHLSIFDSPMGMSDLRAAYRAYWLKDTAWKLRAIGLERFTLPMVKATYDANAKAHKSAIEDAVKNARAMGYILLPEGATVEAMELATKSQSDFKAAIEDLDKECYTAIAGAYLQAMQGNVPDGRGNSKVHQTTAELRTWYLRTCLADCINQSLIPRGIDLNYQDDFEDYPKCTLEGINEADYKPALEIDDGLSKLGLELSKKELYKKYGRQAPIDGSDALKPPDKVGVMPFADEWDDPPPMPTPTKYPVTSFCGGPGGVPGPCGQGKKPTPSEDRRAKIEAAIKAGSAKVKEVAAKAGEIAKRHLDTATRGLAHAQAAAMQGTAQNFLASQLASDFGMPGAMTIAHVAAYAGSKAIVALKGLGRQSEPMAEVTIEELLDRARTMLQGMVDEMGLPGPVPNDDELRAQLESALEQPEQFLDQPEVLAASTAEYWNSREARGEQIPDSEIDEIASQLEGTGWLIYWDDAAQRWAAAQTNSFDFDSYSGRSSSPTEPHRFAERSETPDMNDKQFQELRNELTQMRALLSRDPQPVNNNIQLPESLVIRAVSELQPVIENTVNVPELVVKNVLPQTQVINNLPPANVINNVPAPVVHNELPPMQVINQLPEVQLTNVLPEPVQKFTEERPRRRVITFRDRDGNEEQLEIDG
jgi:hypothetical protein